MPDLVLAAHAHNYQRFTRTVPFNAKKLQIPFIVCGSRGRGITTVAKASGQVSGDHVFNEYLMQYGYLSVKVSAATLIAQFYQVNPTGQQQLADTVNVNFDTITVKRKATEHTRMSLTVFTINAYITLAVYYSTQFAKH